VLEQGLVLEQVLEQELELGLEQELVLEQVLEQS